MKRILIITYYWPPAGGPGVQRWLKFVKYFREFGIEPIVYIPENPTYPLVDDAFVGEIPADIEILKLPIREPYRFAYLFSKRKTKDLSSGILSRNKRSALEKLMLYVRGNFFIPDARVGWVKPSFEFLSGYISKNPVDTIITTGPPHSMHLIGLRLKRKFGINWIADFRDPWTTIHYHKSLSLNKASAKKHRKMEATVLNTADTIVVTSPTTKKEFQAITPKPVEVITNGFDVGENREIPLDRNFSISHIGSLLSGRNPDILWEILQEISIENPIFKENLQLKFAGAVSGEVKESLQKYGLMKFSGFKGYISHSEALEMQNNSQVLLLVEIDTPETKGIIPGKLFEYLAAGRPIIALGPENSDIKEIIENVQAGFYFNYEAKEKLKTQILNYFSDFLKGQLKVSPKEINKYSRRELTRNMSELIHSH